MGHLNVNLNSQTTLATVSFCRKDHASDRLYNNDGVSTQLSCDVSKVHTYWQVQTEVFTSNNLQQGFGTF